MATQAVRAVPPLEYLELDASSERRSEYFGGRMFPLEAATKNHSDISINLNFAVTSQLRARKSHCRASAQDLRVFLPLTSEYAYPDFTVSCGERLFSSFDTLLNPALIAEVLSPKSKAYDLGTKFELYRSIPSLKEYWTIAQDQVAVQQWTIRNSHWTLIEHATLTSVLVHPNFELALSDIYFGVDIP